MIRNPEIDLFSKFTDQKQLTTFKQLLQTSILATDMGRHSKHVEKIQKKSAASIKFRNGPEKCNELEKSIVYNKDSPTDRKVLGSLLLHLKNSKKKKKLKNNPNNCILDKTNFRTN